MGRFTFPLFLIALGVAALLFAGLNYEQVTIEFAFARVSTSVGLALVVTLAIGLLIGILVRGAWVAELLSERGRLRRALKAAETKARNAALEQNPAPPAAKDAG